jgi:hypothetical protein
MLNPVSEHPRINQVGPISSFVHCNVGVSGHVFGFRGAVHCNVGVSGHVIGFWGAVHCNVGVSGHVLGF